MSRIVVFTDGACQGKAGCRIAGSGVWIPSMKKGYACKVPGEQTNQRAELMAILLALNMVENKNIHIMTDSQYSIGCLTNWYKNWERNGWVNSQKKNVENQDIIKECLRCIQQRSFSMEHVKGHSGDVNNDMADKVARSVVEGFTMSNVEEMEIYQS